MIVWRTISVFYGVLGLALLAGLLGVGPPLQVPVLTGAAMALLVAYFTGREARR
jgi:hypothetical protein